MNENDLSIEILGKQNDKTNFCIRKCSKIEQINILQSKDFFIIIIHIINKI